VSLPLELHPAVRDEIDDAHAGDEQKTLPFADLGPFAAAVQETASSVIQEFVRFVKG
jgi:hypothetical protein